MEFFEFNELTNSILILGISILIGLLIGRLKIAGVKVGITGVLLSGLLFGHFGFKVQASVLFFAQEMGLIMFVYTIGILVGPSFASNMRKQGLTLNLLAMTNVFSAVLLTLLISYFGGISIPAAVGMFSGATTNTPSLAASGFALRSLENYNVEIGKLPGLGYAVAYPFGVIGIILCMLLIRILFKIDIQKEIKDYETEKSKDKLERIYIEITSEHINGLHVSELEAVKSGQITVSRILHNGEIHVAHGNNELYKGDVILAVGKKKDIDSICKSLGKRSHKNLMSYPSTLSREWIIVDNKPVIGKSLKELGLGKAYGISITRIRRADQEFTASPEFQLQVGDRLLVIGESQTIEEVQNIIGQSVQSLQHPQIAPIFISMVIGVLLGSLPLPIPGLPASLKLGLAGGPLISAIFFSRIGRIGPLVWFMPQNINLTLREMGIVFFLVAVGLRSGDRFVATLLEGDGFYWMACATLITFIPIFSVSFFARKVLKINYLSIMGLLSGSMTNPPTLAYAEEISQSQIPTIAYATVYPLTMLLRIFSAQLIVLLNGG